MSDLNVKKLAEQFDSLAEVLGAIAGTFRAAGGPAGGAAKPGKAAGKPAGKSSAKVEDAGDDEVDEDTVREKLREVVTTRGKEAMLAVLETVGAAKLQEVDPSQYGDVMTAAQEAIDTEPEEPEEEAPAKKPAAKKAGKKAGPTLEEVKEAAKALKAADAKSFTATMKKFKVAKTDELDEGVYAKFIAACEAAMPAEESSEDEDV